MDELQKYCNMFSQKIGYNFHKGSILLTAHTGCAATEIGGETTTTAFGLHKNATFPTTDEISIFSDLRMSAIDEVSFLDHDRHLKKISNRLQLLTECREHVCGKRPILFLGDFRQLFPVKGKSILKFPNSLYWEEAINCFVELKGTHRFNKCPVMKEIMPQLHATGLSEEHREILNSRVIDGVNVKYPNASKSRTATYFNKARAEHNKHVFRKYLENHHSQDRNMHVPKTALVIKSKPSWGESKQSLSPTSRKIFFEYCTDAHVVNSKNTHCDPFLKLIYGCPIMGTTNANVASGVANGTCSVFEKATFKQGKKPSLIQIDGYWVYAIDIEDVEFITLRWTDSKFEGTFRIYPSAGCFTVKFPIWDEQGKLKRISHSLHIVHFPILTNYATAGHKLQGKSLESLVISEWSTKENWAHVVLSRVRTLDGLFLTSPIPREVSFTPSFEYTRMMQSLRSKQFK